jgi:outer membrane protein insertion porin family
MVQAVQSNLYEVNNFMKTIRFCFALLLVLLCSTFIYAQDDFDGDSIIHKIVLKGLKKAKRKDILSTLGMKEGMILDYSQLEVEEQNLLALDYFEQIKFYEELAKDDAGNLLPNMKDLIIEFYEKPTIRKIMFRGNKNISYGFLINDLTIKRNEFFNKSVVISDISAILERYYKKGYNYAEVDYELFSNEELEKLNQVDLIFTINEGIETFVQEIILEGVDEGNTITNKRISDFTLKSKMKTKERKFLGLQKGVFIESDFYQDLEELRKYYRDQGYYFIEILEPEINRYEIVEEEQEREVIRIKIRIIEGNQYRFGGLILEGNKIFTDDDLTFSLKLKKGSIFNFSKFQEDLFSIRKKYTDSGYVQTMIEEQPVVDDKNSTISFRLKISESKRSYIESVYFRGNTKTKDYVLYRAVFTEVGQIFDSSKLMSSIVGLYNLGFFSKVEYDIQQGSADGLLKVTYLLEEQSTAEVRFGMQITTNKWPPDVNFFAEITERNWLGRELVLGGKVDLSVYKQGFEFKLDDPWFFNLPWSLGTSMEFYHTWDHKILKQLSNEDFEQYEQLSGVKSGYSESDVRNYFNERYLNNDPNNPNYVNAKGDLTKMGIHTMNFRFAARTGYRWAKYFFVQGEYSLSPTYNFMPYGDIKDIYYSEYRDLLEENDGWSLKSTLSASFSINTTKRRINPYQGIKFNVNASYTGIGGTYDYLLLSSKFTAYWTILDLNFNDWPFKNVIVFNAAISSLFPGFRNLAGANAGKGPILAPDDYLFVDGFFVGRGWTNSIGATSYTDRLINRRGFVRMDFSLEYRIPIHDRFVWLAGFVDLVNLVEGPTSLKPRLDPDGNVVIVGNSPQFLTDDEYAWKWWASAENYNPMGIENWYGSMGVGLQLTFPQLPLSFFVIKRFKINQYSGFQWMDDQPSSGNLDFVLSIVGYYF